MGFPRIPRPTDAELAALRLSHGVREIGVMLGCSKSAVEKWIQEARGRGAVITGERVRVPAVALIDWREHAEEILGLAVDRIKIALEHDHTDPQLILSQGRFALAAANLVMEAEAARHRLANEAEPPPPPDGRSVLEKVHDQLAAVTEATASAEDYQN